ncbi:hypothetical protein H2200_009120 [Cladophialophora chaetospira]|uniref:Uncharacterized protein n=1 Tax=Cladophialophora chaetospira TaxID=386627 RepID=A0AA39CFB4_9EURO|nr:hypothetical protein H2200_009120 [Cladophialophora chaetospira]
MPPQGDWILGTSEHVCAVPGIARATTAKEKGHWAVDLRVLFGRAGEEAGILTLENVAVDTNSGYRTYSVIAEEELKEKGLTFQNQVREGQGANRKRVRNWTDKDGKIVLRMIQKRGYGLPNNQYCWVADLY